MKAEHGWISHTALVKDVAVWTEGDALLIWRLV